MEDWQAKDGGTLTESGAPIEGRSRPRHLIVDDPPKPRYLLGIPINPDPRAKLNFGTIERVPDADASYTFASTPTLDFSALDRLPERGPVVHFFPPIEGRARRRGSDADAT